MTRPKGGIENGVHVFPVRVYYEDTDAGGVVYYANYLKFAERARTEMLREITRGRWTGAARPVAFTVRRCAAEYLRPARLDDLLDIHTRLIEVRAATLTSEQVIRCEAEDLVLLSLKLACVTSSGRPVRVPDGLRATLEECCNVNGRN